MKAVPVKWTSGWSSLLLKITWRIESQSAVSLASFCLSKTRVKMMRYDVPFQAAWTYAIPDRSLISQATPFLFNRSLDRKGDSTVILSQCLQPSCKFQDVMHSQRVLCAEGMGGGLGWGSSIYFADTVSFICWSPSTGQQATSFVHSVSSWASYAFTRRSITLPLFSHSYSQTETYTCIQI